MDSTGKLLRISILWTLASVVVPGLAAADGCPDASRILATLGELDLDSAARTSRFGISPPRELYRKAAAEVGRPFADRYGLKGIGAVVVERPIESIWKALMDEDHHDLGEFLPLGDSEVVDGTPRAQSRLLFQRFQKWGFSRWWVVRTHSNADLFESSAGRLWEIHWADAFGENGFEPSPEQTARTAPLESSRGAWLLGKIDERCTLVEHFSHTNPGGALGVVQRWAIRRAIRSSLTGMVAFADQHAASSAWHPPDSFVRPDGFSLSETRAASAPDRSE